MGCGGGPLGECRPAGGEPLVGVFSAVAGYTGRRNVENCSCGGLQVVVAWHAGCEQNS